MNLLEVDFTGGLDATEAEIKNFNEQSLTDVEEFLSKVGLDKNVIFSADAAVTTEGLKLTDYEGLVVSRFRIGGDLHLTFADGLTVNVSKTVRKAREVLEAYRVLASSR